MPATSLHDPCAGVPLKSTPLEAPLIPDPKGISHYYVDVKAVGINGKPVVVRSPLEPRALCFSTTVHVAESPRLNMDMGMEEC